MTGSIADSFVELWTNHPLSAPPAERQRFLEAARVLIRLEPTFMQGSQSERDRIKSPIDTASKAEKTTAALWACVDRVAEDMRAPDSAVRDAQAWESASSAVRGRMMRRILAAFIIARYLPPRLAKGERRPVADVILMAASPKDLARRLNQYLHASALNNATSLLLTIEKETLASAKSESSKEARGGDGRLDYKKKALFEAAAKLLADPRHPKRPLARARKLLKMLPHDFISHKAKRPDKALREFARRGHIEI